MTVLLAAIWGAVLGGSSPAPSLGDKAPDFRLLDQSGKQHRLADYKGKTLVLMFYPKDFTPG